MVQTQVSKSLAIISKKLKRNSPGSHTLISGFSPESALFRKWVVQSFLSDQVAEIKIYQHVLPMVVFLMDLKEVDIFVTFFTAWVSMIKKSSLYAVLMLLEDVMLIDLDSRGYYSLKTSKC